LRNNVIHHFKGEPKRRKNSAR